MGNLYTKLLRKSRSCPDSPYYFEHFNFTNQPIFVTSVPLKCIPRSYELSKVYSIIIYTYVLQQSLIIVCPNLCSAVTEKEAGGDYAEVPSLTSPEPVSIPKLIPTHYQPYYSAGGGIIRAE